MDVSEVKKPAEVQAGSSTNTTGLKQSKVAKNSLAATSVASIAQQTDSVEIRTETSRANNPVRDKANRIINEVNLTIQATEDITNIFSSVEGIVVQAGEQETTPERKKVLEKEANSLLEEARKVAQKATDQSGADPANDEVELQIEKELAPLRKLLPDEAKSSFGISVVDFSTEDAIVNTRIEVERAVRQLKDLSERVNNSSENIRSRLSELEVAAQNSEASQSSIRDVDQALRLGADIAGRIGGDPQNALGSFSQLTAESADLLK
ncbi:MAG: hypothetical protein KDD53_00395 [Bdellovibrionales bacterium]|nr:hypothetical protein [Bdellovibrionales bacterium]